MSGGYIQRVKLTNFEIDRYSDVIYKYIPGFNESIFPYKFEIYNSYDYRNISVKNSDTDELIFSFRDVLGQDPNIFIRLFGFYSFTLKVVEGKLEVLNKHRHFDSLKKFKFCKLRKGNKYRLCSGIY